MTKTMLFLALVISICLFRAQEKKQNESPVSSTLQEDNLIFISGSVGIDPNTLKLKNESFESEVRQVMTNLQIRLKPYGLILDDLVSVVIYLKDMNNYVALNEIYRSYFNKRFPTRTCIAVADLPASASVEISGMKMQEN